MNRKHRGGVKNTVSSPRVKSESRVVPMRRAARVHARGDRALEHRNGYKRTRWMRLSSAPDLYSPGVAPNKEEEDWEEDSASVIFGKKNR
jgi:hypothetical protein